MQSRLPAHLMMILWAALVASSFPVAAQFNPELSASLLVGIRFVAAGVLMWLLRPPKIRITPIAAASYAGLGVLLAGNFVIMFVALRTSDPLNLAAIFVSQPFFAYLISWMVGLETLKAYRFSVLSLAALAALVILTRTDLTQITSIEFGFGEQIYILACVLSAGYNVLSRYSTDHRWITPDPYATTCFSLIGGGILIALPDLFVTDFAIFFSTIALWDWISLGYLTLFTSLGTFWILQFAALRLSPSMVAAYGYQAPLLYLIAELILGFTNWHLAYGVAGLMLILAFFLLAKDRSTQKTQD